MSRIQQSDKAHLEYVAAFLSDYNNTIGPIPEQLQTLLDKDPTSDKVSEFCATLEKELGNHKEAYSNNHR